MRCRRRLGRSPVTVWVCRRLAAGSAGVYSVETEVDALDEVAALPARVCRADDSVGSGSVVGRPVQPAATGREHAHPHVQWRRPRARDLPCPGGRPASRDPSSALGQLTATPAQVTRHRHVQGEHRTAGRVTSAHVQREDRGRPGDTEQLRLVRVGATGGDLLDDVIDADARSPGHQGTDTAGRVSETSTGNTTVRTIKSLTRIAHGLDMPGPARSTRQPPSRP